MIENVRNKPGKLLRETKFKILSKDEFITCKVGKAVTVDRKSFEPGKFVIFARKNAYIVVPGEELHTYVEWTVSKITRKRQGQ